MLILRMPILDEHVVSHFTLVAGIYYNMVVAKDESLTRKHIPLSINGNCYGRLMVIRINFKAIVAILAILFALFLAWSIVDYLRYSTYQIFAENSVTGLVENTPVEFNGVVVGKVSAITFNKTNPKQIKIVMRIKKTTPITHGTVASFDISELITEKLTGFPYIFIDLRDKGDDLRPLTAKPDGKSYSTIPMSAAHPENGKALPSLCFCR